LTVSGAAPLTVEPIGAWTFAGWRLRSTQPAVGDSALGWRQTFRLSPERPGDVPLVVPRLRVQVVGRSSPLELALDPLIIRVTTELPRVDLDEAHPVTGPERLRPEEKARAWPWIAIGGVIGALVALALRLRRRAKSPPEPAPDEWARQQLGKLASLNGQCPAMADELATILRVYLERQYHLSLEGQTTGELAVSLRRAGVVDEQLQNWRDLLDRCDLAKFARAEFTPVESAEAIRRAQTLLAATLPISEIPRPAETGKLR
jgi:hypothetical protein